MAKGLKILPLLLLLISDQCASEGYTIDDEDVVLISIGVLEQQLRSILAANILGDTTPEQEAFLNTSLARTIAEATIVDEYSQREIETFVQNVRAQLEDLTASSEEAINVLGQLLDTLENESQRVAAIVSSVYSTVRSSLQAAATGDEDALANFARLQVNVNMFPVAVWVLFANFNEFYLDKSPKELYITNPAKNYDTLCLDDLLRQVLNVAVQASVYRLATNNSLKSAVFAREPRVVSQGTEDRTGLRFDVADVFPAIQNVLGLPGTAGNGGRRLLSGIPLIGSLTGGGSLPSLSGIPLVGSLTGGGSGLRANDGFDPSPMWRRGLDLLNATHVHTDLLMKRYGQVILQGQNQKYQNPPTDRASALKALEEVLNDVSNYFAEFSQVASLLTPIKAQLKEIVSTNKKKIRNAHQDMSAYAEKQIAEVNRVASQMRKVALGEVGSETLSPETVEVAFGELADTQREICKQAAILLTTFEDGIAAIFNNVLRMVVTKFPRNPRDILDGARYVAKLIQAVIN